MRAIFIALKANDWRKNRISGEKTKKAPKKPAGRGSERSHRR
jgi:hypothetical protein